VSAAGQIALELDVNLGAALLSVRRLGRNSDGEVVDIIDGFYNPKRYQYAMVMSID
jgi:DNA-binding GntR family transcriptional regulator